MKQREIYVFALALLFAAYLGGCNRGIESVAKAPVSDVPSKTDKEADGCCGKCENEDTENKSECCGQCEPELQTTAKQTNTEKQPACEHCQSGQACEECGKQDTTSAKPNVDTKTVSSHKNDRDVFHYLLRNHEKVSRQVTEIENGVRTVTQSDDPAIAAKIQEHVIAMEKRIKQRRPLRMWDDLFREIFRHSDKIKMSVKKTEKGIEVTETSTDPYVAKLIKKHAKVVTGFTKRGFEEAHENHSLPERSSPKAK